MVIVSDRRKDKSIEMKEKISSHYDANTHQQNTYNAYLLHSDSMLVNLNK